MQPSLLVTGASTSLLVSSAPEDSEGVWNLKDKVMNMQGQYVGADRAQIRHELVQLSKQIDHLETSEHDRLARELESVELNIQEVEMQQEWMAAAQIKQKVEAQKHSQEANDRRIAQKMAVNEASAASDEGSV